MQTVRLAALTGPALIAALAVMPAAHAQIAIYSDPAGFNSHLQSGSYLETFDSLPGFDTTSDPLTFSGNGFTYTVFAPGGLFGITANPSAPTDHSLSTMIANAPLTITFTSGNVTAVGGEFFRNVSIGAQTPGSVTVTFNNGTTQTLTATAANPQPFLGFTNAAGIKSLTASGTGGEFATINNLDVGRAAPSAVPEPSSLASLAVGVLGLSLLTLRARKKKASAAL